MPHIPHIFHITISKSHALRRPSDARWLWDVSTGYITFAFRSLRELLYPPWDAKEISHQFYAIGWRSTPLILGTGVVMGVVLAEFIRTSLRNLVPVESVIPAELSRMMFREMGPLMTGLLVSGRVGSAIGAELAVLRLTEQIEALESLAIDSFRYLVVTRVIACMIAMPILAVLMSFAEIAGGFLWQTARSEMSFQIYAHRIFDRVEWSDYVLPMLLTGAYGFMLATISSYFGYTVNQNAEAVRRASTYSVVFSCLVVVAAHLILTHIVPYWSAGKFR